MSDTPLDPNDPFLILKLRAKSAQSAGATVSLRPEKLLALIEIAEETVKECSSDCGCRICMALNKLRQVL